MAAPYCDLQAKTEAALKAVAETVSLANRGQAAVHTGLGTDQLALPYVVCSAQPAEEFPAFSGNYNMECEVVVFSAADPKGTATTLAAHRSRTAYVLDVFHSGTLASDLSAAVTDFTCFGVVERGLLGEEHEERHFTTGMRLRLYCAPSDL